nr:ethylene-responsive transcription factor ERF113 [Ipomoea batatas]GME11088.1 ethylene-responsive transcription factor ERF113 [Ipomoea batatas]
METSPEKTHDFAGSDDSSSVLTGIVTSASPSPTAAQPVQEQGKTELRYVSTGTGGTAGGAPSAVDHHISGHHQLPAMPSPETYPYLQQYAQLLSSSDAEFPYLTSALYNQASFSQPSSLPPAPAMFPPPPAAPSQQQDYFPYFPSQFENFPSSDYQNYYTKGFDDPNNPNPNDD